MVRTVTRPRGYALTDKAIAYLKGPPPLPAHLVATAGQRYCPRCLRPVTVDDGRLRDHGTARQVCPGSGVQP